MTDNRASASRSTAVFTASAVLLLSLACSADNLLNPRPAAGGGPDLSNLPPNTTETLVASGLQSPTAMAVLPDGRVLVNEQCGDIKIVKNGVLLAGDFLTLATDCTGERGILGVTPDPSFATNQKVYVYYTVPTAPVHNRISSFVVSGDKVVAGSETILFNLDNLSANYHNGGVLHFGPDRKLYVGVGENGTSSNAQSMSTVLGKILRLNTDGTIPTDNPFFSTATGNNRAIWALGLRNPWTFGFQNGTGRMFIDDVGELTYEEINDGVAGSNYGWPTCEGPCSPAKPGLKDPFYYYLHGAGCALTGGTFYNPTTARLPSSWVGKYFFVDYCEGVIRAIDPSTKAISTFSSGLSFPVDLQVSSDGYLYYLQRGTGNGQLWRVDGTAIQTPLITLQPSSVLVSVGQSASFTVAASGPGTLTYQWQRGTTNISGATSTTYTLATTALSDSGATFRCVVTNAGGSTPSNSAILRVTSKKPPVVTITSPIAGTTYHGGQTFTYSGSATDGNTGAALPAADFTWKALFHHDTHTHPFIGDTPGVTGGTFTIPTIGEVSANVYYELFLTVTDANGLTTVLERDILPQTSTFTIASTPTGAKATLDGQPVTSPLSTLGVVGIQRTIGAVTPQVIGSTNYQFSAWSDGGAVTHTFLTPATNTTFTATYTVAPPPTTITFVQGNAATNSGSATNSVAFPASTTAGDLIVVGVSWVGTPNFTSLTDNQGDTFIKMANGVNTAGGVRTRMYYAPNVHGGATTVTAMLSGSPSSLRVYAGQYHGASLSAPLDVSTQGTGSAGTATVGPLVTTTANDQLIAICASDGSCTAGSGFSGRATTTGSLLEDRTLGAAGSYTATATSTATWAMVAGAFRPQGSGGTQTPVTASVTAANKVYNGTTAATITSCTLSGNPSGVTCSAASATFASATVGTGKTVTATGITLGGANAGNYALTSTTATTTASITAAPVTASVTAANKVFDGTTTATITSCTLTGSPAGVTCSAAAANFADAAIGTGKTVTATGITLAGTNAGNYSLTSTTATTTANITATATAVTFVQATAAGKAAASNTLTLPASSTAGDLVVVGVNWLGSGTFTSITDNQGNVFSQVGTQVTTAGGVKARLYYAKNIKGGTETITVTLSATDASLQVYAGQYRGANTATPLAANAQATGTSTSVSAGPMTTTTAGNLIVGYCISEASCTPGASFTARSTFSGNLLEDRAAATAGSYSATGTSGARWAMLAAALRP